MPREQTLRFTSRLRAPAATVWQAISTMQGVNAELSPWLLMTSPGPAATTRIEDAPIGTPAFSSWLLLLGVLPVDRHHLAFARVDPGSAFLERSTSWTERAWEHARSVTPHDDGTCTLEDRLRFTPRVALLAPVVARIVRATFTHRHARLRARFGEAS